MVDIHRETSCICMYVRAPQVACTLCDNVGMAVFSPAYLRHVSPASLQYRFFFIWERKEAEVLHGGYESN